jgi:serine/threonine protein kinase
MSVSIISPQLSSKNAKNYAEIVLKGVKEHPALSALADIVNIKHLTKQIKEYLKPSSGLKNKFNKLMGFEPRRMVHLKSGGKFDPENSFFIWNRSKREIPCIGVGTRVKCVFASRISDGKIFAAQIRPVDEKLKKQIYIKELITIRSEKFPEMKKYLVPTNGLTEPYLNRKGIEKVIFIEKYLENGTLENNESIKEFTFEEKIDFGIELFNAVNTYHEAKICLGDMKAANVLLNKRNPVFDDFDVSVDLESVSSFDDSSSQFSGSLYYSSPKYLDNCTNKKPMTIEDYFEKDLWATAVTYFNFLFGHELPWFKKLDQVHDLLNKVRTRPTITLKGIKKIINEKLSSVNWNKCCYESRLNEMFQKFFTGKITTPEEVIEILKDIKSKPTLTHKATMKNLQLEPPKMEVEDSMEAK